MTTDKSVTSPNLEEIRSVEQQLEAFDALFTDFVASVDLDPDAASLDTHHAADAMREGLRDQFSALLSIIADLQADALRYRFLRPFLTTDGDVDHPDHASRFYSWLLIENETIPLPDAIGWSNVDDAIDNAIAQSSSLPVSGEQKP